MASVNAALARTGLNSVAPHRKIARHAGGHAGQIVIIVKLFAENQPGKAKPLILPKNKQVRNRLKTFTYIQWFQAARYASAK